MLTLKLCLVFCATALIKCDNELKEEEKEEPKTFEGASVIGYSGSNFDYVRVSDLSVHSLSEDPRCRSFIVIKNINGHLPILRKNSVTDLLSLRSFEKYYGHLEHIEPGAFKNLPKLEHISITWSALQEVEEGVFNDLPVKRLDLSANAITRVAARAFDNMTNLETIDLHLNKFTRWNLNWFQNTPKLHYLNFDQHQMEELPDDAFRSFRHKKGVTFIFTHGPLKKVGNNLFDGLKNVDVLNLNYNKIENFGDDALRGVETMTKLELMDNKIECFSGDFSRIFVANCTTIGYNPAVCDADCMKNITAWQDSVGRPHSVPVDATGYYCSKLTRPGVP